MAASLTKESLIYKTAVDGVDLTIRISIDVEGPTRPYTDAIAIQTDKGITVSTYRLIRDKLDSTLGSPTLAD